MASIPKIFFDCVVAIGLPGDNETSWVATGFLFGYPPIENLEQYHSHYLVTNVHVFQGLKNAGAKQAILRFNPTDSGEAREFPLDLLDASSGQDLWTPHPNSEIDVAVIAVSKKTLEDNQLMFSYFETYQHCANLEQISQLGLTEGDLVYVLGFPMGNVGKERNYIIVRHGTIARIQDTIERKRNDFLIDSFVFPGNSGGPVIVRPERLALKVKPSNGSCFLIGIVKAYMPYRDIAFSEQTKQPRLVSEENSGLASVIPVDFITETINEDTQKIIQNFLKK
jgi:hypothetical protein